MVTKQQQLELIAKECHAWKGSDFILVSDTELGFRIPVTAGWHLITRQEWQQERDRMSKTPDVTISNQTSATIASTQTGDFEMTITAQDNSWHERGEFPRAGIVCEAEYDTQKREWNKARVIGVDSGECFLRWLDGRGEGCVSNYKNPSDFRPLRTEREKAMEEIIKAMIDVATTNLRNELTERMRRAGFRMENPQ